MPAGVTEVVGLIGLIGLGDGSDARFLSDEWSRSGGGGGLTRILQGEVIEKGGVATSAVFGELTPAFAAQLPGSGTNFFATGVSLVLHPKNPFVPTVHANFRYIEHGERRCGPTGSGSVRVDGSAGCCAEDPGGRRRGRICTPAGAQVFAMISVAADATSQ